MDDPIIANGTFVKDVLSPNDTLCVNYTYEKNISYEFFLA